MNIKARQKSSFVHQMHSKLLQYQLQKLNRLELKHSNNSQHFQKQRQAKQQLIDLDTQKEQYKLNDDDIFLGRWSNYKLPEKIQHKLNHHTIKKNNRLAAQLRVATESAKSKYKQNSHSEKTIPKLKYLLQQLESPVHRPARSQPFTSRNESSKIKKSIGARVLLFSNRQEIKHQAIAERKSVLPYQYSDQIQNKRPKIIPKAKLATIVHGQNVSLVASAQSKTRKLIQQREVLSQLLKGSYRPASNSSPLKSMLTYFSISNTPRRTKSNLLTVNKILS